MFDWFSLAVIYYPVSAIMWVWYKLFSAIPGLGPTSFFTWALSVMFLVFTLRALLYKPFVRQIRTTRQMQELQPQIKALQKKYGKDRQRMALEMQKLQREHGFNPILGCLPMLAQIPVFIGLYHVLMSFNRTQTGLGRLGLSVEENRQLGNYVFSATDVAHFLDAHIFGAPIGAAMTSFPPFPFGFSVPPGTGAFTEYHQWAVMAVGFPVMIAAGLATHFNSRASVARQSPEAAANPQTALMNKMALWVFPIGVVAFGPVLPLAILVYWFSNNIWTFGQQHYVFGKIEKEEEAKKREAMERRSSNAPAPGAKPKRAKKAQAVATPTEATDGVELTTSGTDESPTLEKKPAAKQVTPAKTNGAAKTNGGKPGAAKPGGGARSGGAATNRTPRPGARPKRRKR